MCGGTQSPYLRAEVSNTPMTQENEEPIHERDSRGVAKGEDRLRHDEFICPEEQDYIGDSPTSVLMHMRSVHNTNGDEDVLIEDIAAESQFYRNSPLPPVKDNYYEENGVEPLEEDDSGNEPTAFQKFLSAISLGIYDPN